MAVKKSSRSKKSKKAEPKKSLKQKMTEMLELPKEVVLNIPKLTMLGNSDLMIQNYKGVFEYEENRIKINTGAGIIKIAGQSLSIKEITSEDIMVIGKIESLEFLKN